MISLAETPALDGDDRFHSVAGSVQYIFSPEDEKKMEGMTHRERRRYRAHLIAEGQCKEIICLE